MAASSFTLRVSYRPRLCENAKAINRDRTSHSFKTVLGAYIASAFNLKDELKNIILIALRSFEFSHGLGHKRTQALQQDALVFGFALEAMAAGSVQ